MKNHKNLIHKFLKNTISEKEIKSLRDWLLESKANKGIFKLEVENYNTDNKTGFDTKTAFKKFLKTTQHPVFKINSLYKYAAILIVALFTTYSLFLRNDNKENNTIVSTKQQPETKTTNDSDAITITLSDGSTQILSNNNDDQLKDKNGNIIAQKGHNSLVFSDNNPNNNEPKLNEIYVPNGKTFKIELSDGTIVWLNSETKFKFPQDFKYNSDQRLVHLDGEALFDVTSNKQKPFIVDNNGVDIKVLGTVFNVSSYGEDNSIATTLVEGKVSIANDINSNNIIVLKPGQQSVFNKASQKMTRRKVDTDVYTSWIHNKLIINNLTFDEILTRLERKFDVDFINNTNNLNEAIYKGEFTDEDLEIILKTISYSTTFNYEIKNKKIIITN